MTHTSSVQTQSRQLSCPVCAVTMDTVRREQVVFERCPECRGVFLDRGELERLVAVELEHGSSAIYEQPANEDDEPDQAEKLSTRRSFFSELFDKD